MKKIIITILLSLLTFTVSCAEAPTLPKYTGERVEINFTYTKRAGMWSNQFVLWIEDNTGKYIKTIYLTEGMFKKELYKKREQALANWKKKVDVNNISDEEIDSFSYATPKVKNSSLRYAWDLKDKNGVKVPDGTYKFLLEGTIYKDHYVIYSGDIVVSGNMQTVKINTTPYYSTENAKQSDMLSQVYAEYYKN